VDVGPFVVSDAQAAKLIQPRKCSFHHPAPASQVAAVPRSTHGQQRMNLACAQTITDGRRVIRTIAEDAVRTAPWSPSLTLERRNRVDQRQRFLRVMPVGTSQTDGQRHALSVADHVTFAPSFGAICWIRTGLRPATHRPHRAAIEHRPRPVNLVVTREPIE